MRQAVFHSLRFPHLIQRGRIYAASSASSSPPDARAARRAPATASVAAISQPVIANTASPPAAADSSVVRHLQRVAQMESLPASSDVERAHQQRMSPVDDTDADSQVSSMMMIKFS